MEGISITFLRFLFPVVCDHIAAGTEAVDTGRGARKKVDSVRGLVLA